MTARLRAACSGRHERVGRSEDAAAERIRADRIDVPIDRSGPTGVNRSGIFGRAPAPVRISALGHPGVPVVTLTGDRPASRVGASRLAAVAAAPG